MGKIKFHRHTWARNNILCDYSGCYEGSPQSWQDTPFTIKIIVYLMLLFVAFAVGVIVSFFIGVKGFLVGLLIVLTLVYLSSYYGITLSQRTR